MFVCDVVCDVVWLLPVPFLSRLSVFECFCCFNAFVCLACELLCDGACDVLWFVCVCQCLCVINWFCVLFVIYCVML